MSVAALATPLIALASCGPPSHPLIAELYYDAIGDDTGFEFVELFNPSPHPYPLAGARLEAGDGSGPDRWTPRWTGGPADTVPAGGRFVLGGARVTPPAQAVVALELQNGPDAVRLVWADGAVEVVGYGALAWAGYACGSPAPDVPSGLSLARTPDDADLGSNALDFVAAVPSPGAANRPGRDAALVAGSLAAVPEQPAPGAPVTVLGVVANRGAEEIAGGELELAGAEAGPPPAGTLGSAFLERGLAPGDTARFALALGGLAAGRRVLRVSARLAGDAAAANDADSLVLRVGPGPLEVTEIQFHPGAGEGEWVEVRNRSGEALRPDEFTLADRRGAPGLPAGGQGALAAESLAVFAQDRAALLAGFPGLDGARVWEVRPWGSLNNGDDSTGVADVVTLRERDGTPCERVPYSAAGVPAGVPVERRPGGGWAPAAEPLGGPLAPPRALPPLALRFAVTPRRLGGAGATVATLGWDLPWPRGRIVVDLYDLAGRRVAQVLPETSVPPRGERPWTVQGLAPGVYVLALLARAESGAGSLTASQAVRIAGSAP
jgi:hypothetical protein